MPHSTFRGAGQWILSPQHLHPAPLSWTGRSREGSWSHFRGLITACPGTQQGETVEYDLSASHPSRSPVMGEVSHLSSEAVPLEGNRYPVSAFPPSPQTRRVPDRRCPGFRLRFRPSLLVPTQPPPSPSAPASSPPAAQPARARGLPQCQGFLVHASGPWYAAEATSRSGDPQQSWLSGSNPGERRRRCSALSHPGSRPGATDRDCPRCRC